MRKKWLVLSPEEWVRQHLINYLIEHKNVPISLISVEKEIILNNTKRHYNVVIYNKTLNPVLLIECKAPDVELNNSTIEQAMRYNLILGVNYLLLSNGLKDVILKIEEGKTNLLKEIPDYEELIKL